LTADDPFADLDLGSARSGEVKVGPRAETDHSNALSGGDGIAGLLPADDPSGDETSNLTDQKRTLGGTQKPGLVFVADIDFEVASIKEFASRVVGFFNRTCKGAAVDVDIEDGEENADAAKLPKTERGVLCFVDTDHFSVCRADEGEWIGRRGAFGISEKEKQAYEKERAQEDSDRPSHPEG
jgi:hypothetical protein